MPYRFEIPVTSENDCVRFFKVEYRKDFETVFRRVSPDPLVSPLIIEGLDGASNYVIRITPFCCNGQQGPAVTINQATPGGMPT